MSISNKEKMLRRYEKEEFSRNINPDGDNSYDLFYGNKKLFTDIISDSILDGYRKDKNEKRREFIGVVLRVENDRKQNTEKEPGSFPYRKDADRKRPLGLLAIKARVSELHSMLPIPASMDKNDCNPGKGIVSRCSNPVIDLYPTFYSTGPRFLIPNVGDLVRVSFASLETFEDPIFIGINERFGKARVVGSTRYAGAGSPRNRNRSTRRSVFIFKPKYEKPKGTEFCTPFESSSGRERVDIDSVVIHDTAGYKRSGMIETLLEEGLSTHFSIQQPKSGVSDPFVCQHEKIERIAFHSGKFNRRSIGIDFVNPIDKGDFNKNLLFDPGTETDRKIILRDTSYIVPSKWGGIIINTPDELEKGYELVSWTAREGLFNKINIALTEDLFPQFRNEGGQYRFYFSYGDLTLDPSWYEKGGIIAHAAFNDNRSDGSVQVLYMLLRRLGYNRRDAYTVLQEILIDKGLWNKNDGYFDITSYVGDRLDRSIPFPVTKKIKRAALSTRPTSKTSKGFLKTPKSAGDDRTYYLSENRTSSKIAIVKIKFSERFGLYNDSNEKQPLTLGNLEGYRKITSSEMTEVQKYAKQIGYIVRTSTTSFEENFAIPMLINNKEYVIRTAIHSVKASTGNTGVFDSIEIYAKE